MNRQPSSIKLTPPFQRELVRLANRDREPLNATEVSALIEFAGIMVSMSGEDQEGVTALALFETWKESFDVEPQPGL